MRTNPGWLSHWVLPGLGALALAGALSDTVSGGGNRSGLGIVTFWLVLPIAFYYTMPAVGFLCGLIGYKPVPMTARFSSGWSRGIRLARRAVRSTSAGVPVKLQVPRIHDIALPDLSARGRSRKNSLLATTALLSDANSHLTDHELLAVARPLVQELAGVLILSEMGIEVTETALVQGLALARAEEEQLQPRPHAATPELHNALCLATSGLAADVGGGEALVMTFALHAGYFVGREGLSSFGMILDLLKTDLRLRSNG